MAYIYISNKELQDNEESSSQTYLAVKIFKKKSFLGFFKTKYRTEIVFHKVAKNPSDAKAHFIKYKVDYDYILVVTNLHQF
jgi:hypothetical protein